VEGAVRYVAEGHLHGLVETHGLERVWEAVAAHIDRHPELLARNQTERAAARTQRHEKAAAFNHAALAAFKAGDHDRARELVDAGELVDPDYIDKDRCGWDVARHAIDAARARDGRSASATGERSAAAADPPSRKQATVEAGPKDSGLDFI
jgi:hypothetical protein